MFRFFPYTLKTLIRHGARSLLTVSGSAVALFVFCFVAAVQNGLDDLVARQEANQVLVAFQANKFCPFTSNLRQDYAEKMAKLPGVREVVPIQVFTNNCRASLDVVVFYGLPPTQIRKVRDFRLTSGSWEEFEKHQNTAIAGRAVAQRRGLTIGKSEKIGDVQPVIAGIFESENPNEENYIYTHLDFLQRRRSEEGRKDLVGTVTQFELHLLPGADPWEKSRQVDELFRGAPEATDTRPKGVFQQKSLGDLTELIGLSHYLGLACIGLVLVLVATTTLMSVQDRVAEHAILQTLGCSSRRIFSLVMWESVLLSTTGGAVGIALAMGVLAWSRMAVGAEAVTIVFLPSWSLAATGMAIAVATGIVAGIAPALAAARAEIVPALRHA